MYNVYKKREPKDTVYAVCMALVDVINERYGLLKKSEVKAYIESKLSNARFVTTDDDYSETAFGEDNVDFDILDSKESYGRRPAPSDKYLKFRPIDLTKTKKWSREIRQAVETESQKHSKTNTAYDPVQYQRETNDLQEQLREEIEIGLEWAEQVAGAKNTQSLPEPLLL